MRNMDCVVSIPYFVASFDTKLIRNMERTGFKAFLMSNFDVEESKLDAMISKCTVRNVEKDEFLLREGEFLKCTFFVEKGLLKQYSIDEKGKEHILYFAAENWFVTDRESIFFNQASKFYIQALENTQVVVIDDGFIQLLSLKVPGFANFNTRMLHNHIRHLQGRINLLLSADAEDRYLKFVAMYPDILARVPQTMIASYLGITPESLSRVRKNITLNKG